MKMETKKSQLMFTCIKIIAIILTILCFCIVCIKIAPLLTNLSSTEGQLAFKTEINHMGAFGFLVVLGLQVLQIIVAFLPGEPLEILAGMCYGTWGGLLLIFLGSFISSAFIFFLVRKYGRNFMMHFLSEKSMDKIENSKLLSNPQKVTTLLLILFMIPGTPKDFLVYLGGLLPIKPTKFLLISTFARFPSVISSTFAGANLSKGNWEISIIAFMVAFIIAGIGILVNNMLSKRSLAHEMH